MAEQTPTAVRPPLLNLDALIARPSIVIRGATYEMRDPDELSILENRRIITWGERAEELERLPDATDEQIREYDDLLKRIVSSVLVAPADVLEGLTSQQRAAVGVAFLRLWLDKQKAARQPRAEKSPAETETMQAVSESPDAASTGAN